MNTMAIEKREYSSMKISFLITTIVFALCILFFSNKGFSESGQNWKLTQEILLDGSESELSPDGAYLIKEITPNGTLEITPLLSSSKTFLIPAEYGSKISFSRDSEKMAVATSFNFSVWDLKNGVKLFSIPGRFPLKAPFSLDGSQVLALGDQDDNEPQSAPTYLLDVASGKVITTLPPGHPDQETSYVSGDGRFVSTMTVHPTLFPEGANTRIIETVSGKTKLELQENIFWFSDDGDYFMTGKCGKPESGKAKLKLYSTSSWKALWTINSNLCFANVAYSQSAQQIQLSDQFGHDYVETRRIRDGKLIWQIRDGTRSLGYYSPRGNEIVQQLWNLDYSPDCREKLNITDSLAGKVKATIACFGTGETSNQTVQRAFYISSNKIAVLVYQRHVYRPLKWMILDRLSKR